MIQPSYKTGFARSASEAQFPELRRGLVGAWVPSLGTCGTTLFDISGGRHHAVTQNNMADVVWDSNNSVTYLGDPRLGYLVDLSWFDNSKFCIVSVLDGPLDAGSGSALINNKNVGIGTWGGAAGTQLLFRGEASNTNNIRNLLTLSGSSFDNTISGTGVAGINTIAFQYDEATHIGQQFYNGVVDESSGGAGTVSPWTTHEIWGYSSSSQRNIQSPVRGKAILLYNRWLTENELNTIRNDHLSPFRLKNRITTWAPSSGPATGYEYEIEYRKGDEVDYIPLAVVPQGPGGPGPNNSYQHTNRVAGTEYCYRIRTREAASPAIVSEWQYDCATAGGGGLLFKPRIFQTNTPGIRIF